MANRTHCPHGHAYDDENTYRWTDAKGHEHRYCRPCQRASWRRWRERQAS